MRQAPERPISGPFQEVLACCGNAALLIDAKNGAIADANAAGWDLLGIDRPEPLDCAMPALQQLRTLGADACKRRVALTFWTPRGSIRTTCEVSTLDDRGGLRLVRLLDVDHSHRSEPAAHRAKGHACRPPRDVALKSKLAHELRTPLGAVIAYAEILKDEHFGPNASERYKTYARNIHESARHAMGVLDGMLESEEEASGAPQLTFADIDPARIVESCLLVAQPMAEKAGLVLSAEVPPHLPRIVADAVSLRQMLLNLLANAIKFARRGDRVRVAVDYDIDGPLRISVVDTGPGMEEADHAAGTAARRHERIKPANAGLGLGLPLTRSLAEANGAVLAIDSALGRGTCATISFGKDRLVPV